VAGVQSIERAFAILRVLALGPAGVTEVADRTDLPKSTVSRLLAALESEGAVEQVDGGAEYVVGESLRTLGGSSGPRATLRAVIRPFIEGLSQATGASAGFTVLRGREVYWVDNVDNDDAMVQVSDQTGQSFPLHTVPSGLALLKTFDAQALDDYLAHKLRRVHDGTITDPERLRRRVDAIDSDGVVVSNEELDPGINAVAVPFRGPSGAYEGALYVQGPSFRFPVDGDVAPVRRLVAEAAAAISERFEAH
jgi:DNA-binding IclR family transcriptional regulator